MGSWFPTPAIEKIVRMGHGGFETDEEPFEGLFVCYGVQVPEVGTPCVESGRGLKSCGTGLDRP